MTQKILYSVMSTCFSLALGLCIERAVRTSEISIIFLAVLLGIGFIVMLTKEIIRIKEK